MVRKLILTPTFKKAFQRFVKRNPDLQKRIENTLIEMQQDVFVQHLGTHKLSGKLWGLRSASCGYDCRIIFTIEKNEELASEVIVLLNIGTHDIVY
jgi:mRNA interferase YafQ